MTDIATVLRDKLAQHACITLPKVMREEVSDDGTRKWLLTSVLAMLLKRCLFRNKRVAHCAFLASRLCAGLLVLRYR